MDRAQRHRGGGPRDDYRRHLNRELAFEERACTSKVPFDSREHARSVARHGRQSDGSVVPYHCPVGDHWHLGHPRRRPAPASDQARRAAKARRKSAARPVRRTYAVHWVSKWAPRRNLTPQWEAWLEEAMEAAEARWLDLGPWEIRIVGTIRPDEDPPTGTPPAVHSH